MTEETPVEEINEMIMQDVMPDGEHGLIGYVVVGMADCEATRVQGSLSVPEVIHRLRRVADELERQEIEAFREEIGIEEEGDE